MEKEKASAKRMRVGERKHLKSILFIHNVTRDGMRQVGSDIGAIMFHYRWRRYRVPGGGLGQRTDG